jgi:hypothetical protein
MSNNITLEKYFKQLNFFSSIAVLVIIDLIIIQTSGR